MKVKVKVRNFPKYLTRLHITTHISTVKLDYSGRSSACKFRFMSQNKKYMHKTISNLCIVFIYHLCKISKLKNDDPNGKRHTNFYRSNRRRATASVHRYFVRNKENLRLPFRHKLEIGKRVFKYRVMKLRNNLRMYIKLYVWVFFKFKKLLKQHLLARYYLRWLRCLWIYVTN